jgi:hypothetical protein
MSTDLKRILVLEFDGASRNWEGWNEKFCARGRRKGYKKLLLGEEAVPTQSEFDKAVADSDEKTKKLGELNEEAFEDIILSINHTSKQGKVAFSLVKNCKTTEYPEGNCKLAWDCLVAKYAPKTAPSLLKLKKEFENCKLESIAQYPDEWITSLESLRNDMDSINISAKMSDIDFMMHILNNLPELYDVVLDDMENRLMLKDTDPHKLTIEEVRDKLNNRFVRIDDREHGNGKGNDETALVTHQFKGTCSKCGKYGHKGVDCRYGMGFTGMCYYCGKTGHTKPDCELRKAHMQGIGEKANIAVEESDDSESNDELCF